MERRYGFVLVAAMVGNEVHHDHNLAAVYESTNAREVRLHRLA